MDKQDYKNEMIKMLSDFEWFYLLVNKDPTKILIKKVHELLTRWWKKMWIHHLPLTKKFLKATRIYRAYGLQKMYKEGASLRIIISSVDSSLCLLTFLHTILSKSSKCFSHIDNSFQLVNKLKNILMTFLLSHWMLYYFLQIFL